MTARPVGWAMPMTYLLAVVTHAVLEARLAQEGGPVTLEQVVLYSAFGCFALLGGLIVALRPRNAMGWILGVTGLLFGVFAASHAIAAHVYLATSEGSVLVALLTWPNVWFWYALLVVVVVVLPLLLPTGRLPSSRWRIALWVPDVVGSIGLALVVNAIPLAIGLAVLRFRLYEIDRLVSRTATYAPVVGALAALYAATVVALQALLAPIAWLGGRNTGPAQ